jgi:predicted RNase H-like HicB family nuclease
LTLDVGPITIRELASMNPIRFLQSLFRRPTALKLSVQFYVEPDAERFHAFSPALKGLHADGATEDEVVSNFVASLAKHGDPLPIRVTIESIAEAEPAIPAGAFMGHIRQVELSWPSQDPSGIN